LNDVEFFIAANFPKVRQLKKSDKGEVWLTLNKTGEPVILKKINFIGLPYLKLKENPHPLWAKIFHVAEIENQTIVVEEFIGGENLSERKFLTKIEARKFLLQMCDGLKFLHGLGIIHRDIKPSNLIVQAGKIIRLLDFDAARIFKFDKDEDTKFLGTKGYAPPEQFGFGQTDARSDIYSLGVTVQKILGENYDGYLKKILSRCTELDPAKRYQSVEEILADIDKKFFLYKTKKVAVKISATCATALLIFTAIKSFSEVEEISAPVKSVEEIQPQKEKPKLEKAPPREIQKKLNGLKLKFPNLKNLKCR